MDLERYRKDAKALVRAFRARDAEAMERAAAVLGGRAYERFQLSDAQHVVAVEHGYRTWPELRRAAETAAPANEGQHEGSSEVVAALAAIRRGDVDELCAQLDQHPWLSGRVHSGAWASLLEAIAQPDVVGKALEGELGVDPAVVSLLIERGSELDGALNLAACFNRVQLVRMLLDAGADPAPDPARGLTPLETALYHGARESAELLAGRELSPLALWSAAALGRVDLMARLHGTGAALAHRPNLADVGWPPAPPPGDDEQTVLDEALCFAALNGREEAVEWLLDRGADPSGAPYLGMTPLHFAVAFSRAPTVGLLLERGADPERQDRIHAGTPAGWARFRGNLMLAGLIEGIDTGLEYVPGEPVRLRVDVRRFPYVLDEGRAVALAGRPDGWRDAAEWIALERTVNISRGGVVSLPVVAAGPGFDAIADRIAKASVELYQELLELSD